MNAVDVREMGEGVLRAFRVVNYVKGGRELKGFSASLALIGHHLSGPCAAHSMGHDLHWGPSRKEVVLRKVLEYEIILGKVRGQKGGLAELLLDGHHSPGMSG